MRLAEVRVSPKRTPVWTMAARRKEMSRQRRKESDSKPCSVLGPSIHTSMSRSCRDLGSGLLSGATSRSAGRRSRRRTDNLQSSPGEHMSGGHSGIPDSVPNCPYDVAAQALPVAGRPCERIECQEWLCGAPAEAGRVSASSEHPRRQLRPRRDGRYHPCPIGLRGKRVERLIGFSQVGVDVLMPPTPTWAGFGRSRRQWHPSRSTSSLAR
jgi:hypothetical protein